MATENGEIVWSDENKTKVKWEKNEQGKWKIWKPSLFQRFMYWLGLMKDPRYNGKKMSNYHLDEYIVGFDPYDKDK